MRNPTTQSRAKELRNNLTKAETILWKHLKGNNIEGIKFRRLFPIGPFIVDFAAIEIKLVIEVDGATHTSNEEVLYDQSRTAFLEKNNWRIVRVWNSEIYKNLSGVLLSISQTVYELKQAIFFSQAENPSVTTSRDSSPVNRGAHGLNELRAPQC